MNIALRFGYVMATVIFFVSTSPLAAKQDVFVGAKSASITGNVLLNDSGGQNAALISEPAFGQLLGGGISANGEFSYLPDPGFEGVDHFVYAIDLNGQRQIFQVRLLSGAVQLLSANDPSLALTTATAANRSPVTLQSRSSSTASHWLITNEIGDYQLQTLVEPQSQAVLETWQPQAAGTDVTVYKRNGLPWQSFYLEASRFGNDVLRSRYTDFTLTRIEGNLTAQQPDGTSKDNWLITGVDQVPPPSSRDDRFVVAVNTQFDGNVLNNDRTNSADIAAFLVAGPEHGQFVGINELIYGGLAPFGAFSYQPNEGFEGLDSFYYITRGSIDGAPSQLVRVTLRVGRADQPVAVDDLFILEQDSSIQGRVSTNDTNLGGVSGGVRLVAPPRYGSLVGLYQSLYDGLAPFGDFEYQAPPGFQGIDTFAYEMFAGTEVSQVATVYLVVGDVQIAPLFNWRLNLGTASDSNRSLFMVADEQTLVSTTFSPEPSLQVGNIFLRYANKALETWQPNATGRDAGLYTLNLRLWQQFRLNLNQEGSVALVSAYTGKSLGVEAQQSDALVVAELPGNGVEQQWLLAGPSQGFPPIGRDDEFTMPKNSVLQGRVLGNDTANGFDLLALPVTQPKHGQLIGLGASLYGGVTPWGAFTYEPNADFVGEDTFVYQVLSFFGSAPSRYVTVTVTVAED